MTKNSRGTEPARQRDGKSYPGGKHLRKAHERLATRRQGCEEIHAALSRRTNKTVPLSAYKMPGSMTK